MQTSQDYLVGGMELRRSARRKTSITICSCINATCSGTAWWLDLQVKYFVELMLVPFYVTCKIPVLFWRPFLSAKMAYISYKLTAQKNCGAWLKY